MARQMSNFIIGKLDGIIYYRGSKKFLARKMPDIVKQSRATKIRGRNFGISSATGAVLRRLLLPSLTLPKAYRMAGRFSGAIAKWLKLSSLKDLEPTSFLPFVNQFNFNEKSSITEKWGISLTVSQPSPNLLEVHIPAFVPAKHISAPARTVMVECVITAASCRLKDVKPLGNFTARIQIPYNNIAIKKQVLSLPISTTKGALVITAASFMYVLGGRKLNENIAFMPSSVIDARYC
jgi:hypothetical protein